MATHPNSDKFAPRLGSAWNALDEKTTIRGGYGLLWAPFLLRHDAFTPLGYTNSTPYVASINNGNVTPSGSLSEQSLSHAGILQPSGNGAGLGGRTGRPDAVTYLDPNAHSTRIHQYSLDVQRELPAGFVVAVGYAGSITHNLIQGTPSININQLPDKYLLPWVVPS